MSALAPGNRASTWMVGKSTCGSGATGSWKYATIPIRTTPIASSEVPIRLRMKTSERLILHTLRQPCRPPLSGRGPGR